MKWSVPLGRVGGIPIRIHISFVLLLAWIAWLGWGVNGLASSLWAVTLISCLFLCVVLHELGHSFVAIHFGSEVRSVTLYPIGGVASMKSIPEKPYQELLVSIAGPSVNMLIVLLLAALRGGFPSWADVGKFPASGGELVDALIRANIILAVFNLLPAFPMDGGRVMRSLLALFLPYPRATAVAAMLGQLIAVGFILLGLALNPFLVIIGFFVFFGAETEERSVRVKNMLRDVHAGDVMLTEFTTLNPDDSVGRCLEYVYHHRQEDFPVILEGRIVGILARKDWLAALHREGPDARVSDIMTRHFISVSIQTPLSKIYQDLAALKQGVFPVIENGQVRGLLTADDISRFLLVEQARKRREKQPPPESRPIRPSSFTVDLG